MEKENEETKAEPETKTEETTEETSEEELTEAEELKKLTAALKEENDRRSEIIMKEEKAKAEKLLGGKGEGAPQDKKKEEISDVDYAKATLAGENPDAEAKE